MKNLGITNYASLVSIKLNKEMKIHVNPVEETSNVHYVLPLYKSRYKRPLGLQLIYNHQNLSTDLGLGKGIRTNYHMSLDYNDNEAYLTLVDGATITYPLDFVGNSGKTRVYKNSETNTTISVTYGTYDPQFFLYYKDGSVIDFAPVGNRLMVKLIRKKNGERYSFEYDSSGRMIEAKNNAVKTEKLTFDYTTNDYVLIQAWKTNKTGIFEEVKAMKVYKNTATNFLNFLWKVQILDKISSTTLLKDYYFGYSLPNYCLNIDISEQLSNLSCSIKFDESIKVKSITDELGRQTTFSKINKYTTKLTDYRNKETELVIDGEGRLICAKDNFRNMVISTMFDDNNKTISTSKVIHLNPHLNGKLQVMNSGVSNELMSAFLTNMPSFLSDFYQVSKCYRVSTTSGSGAKYVQIYNIEGNKFDVYSLGVWTKINAFGSLLSYATINVFFANDLSNYASGKQFSKEIKIKPKDVDSQQFEFYMTSAYAKQSYKYVVVELCYYNDTMSMDVIFDLYKRGLTSLYEYDENGNQITMMDGRNISELVFNEDNTLSINDFSNYNYDENGNIIRTSNSFGNREEIEYDNSNNLLTHSVIDGDNEILNSVQYLDEECIELFEDENEIEIEKEQSDIYITTKDIQKYDENNKLYENYEYSSWNKDQLVHKKYKENDTTEIGKINYTYLSDGKISSFFNDAKNSKIQFTYDQYGRHLGYKINNNIFLHNSYLLINGIPALIDSTGTGTKDAYNYIYDDYDRLIKIIYSLNLSTLFEYTYDDKDNIKTIKDCTTNITYTYEYDEDNNLITCSYDDFVINNILDESNSLCAKKVNIENDKIITTSHSIFKSLNNDFDAYKMSIRNNTDIMLCMFDEFAISYRENQTSGLLTKYDQKIKLLNTKNKTVISCDSTTKESNCDKDGFMTLYNLDSSNSFMFNVVNKVNPKNSVAFSFKPTSSGTIISMEDGTTVSLNVGLNSLNKIVVIDNGQTIFTSSKSYSLNTWHFMCLTYDLSSNLLQVQIDDDKYSIIFNNVHTSLHIFTFGVSIVGQITNIMIPQKGVINEEDYDSYFKSFKYLLALNENRKDTSGNVMHKSSKEFIRNFPYDFIPLNNGTAGFKNNETILPISDSVLELPCLSSKNAEFIYNDSIEKSAYFAMGQHLVYDLNQSTSGTLSIHANRLFKDEENILFDLVDSNNNHITLSIMADKLKLIFGDTYTISSVQSLLNQTNIWNVITLTWNKNNDNRYDVILWLNNNKVINKALYPSTTFSSLNVHVGRNSDVTSKYGNCFNGLLEMLVFTDTFISDSVQSIVSSVNKQNKITHEYDILNLLNKSKIFDNDDEILTNSYEYKELTNDSSSQLTRISTLVKIETINNDVYQYEYDVRGNVKTIKKNGVTLHQYSYDELGRLSSSNNEKYIYDSNGNITSVTDLEGNVLHTYEYDSNYSDLLVGFDGKQITYDSGNTYNPISIGNDKTLTYQCNKLKTFRDTTKLFYNVYDYDSSGNRIKKVRYNGSGTALETLKYYYDDSGKLIYQKVDSYISLNTHNESLTFMYDELNQLYGFIYNNEKYYYIKNIFNTILGIVDSTGNIVVQYNYDAWGNILSVEDNSTNLIGTINPFKYKGYYYDSDIEMYYCKARYYVPLWKRWLTPDNPAYLNYYNINDLNLFAYCQNNSISYSDNLGTYSRSYINRTDLFCNMSSVFVQKEESYGGLVLDYSMTIDGIVVKISLKQDNYTTNIQILNSFTIDSSGKMREILKSIMNSSYVKTAKACGYLFRDIDSYILEWKAHNFAYNYAKVIAKIKNRPVSEIKNRAKDVDLNYDWENDEMYDLYSWSALLYDLNNALRIEPILLPIIYPIF